MSRPIAALVVAVALAAAACNARRSEPLNGPLRTSNADVRKGAILFDRHCDKCHSGGEEGFGPAINNKPLPGFLVRFQIRHGIGAMPGFGEDEISDAEVDQIIEYLHALRAQGDPPRDS